MSVDSTFTVYRRYCIRCGYQKPKSWFFGDGE
jgi:hypothetical protein